MTASLAKCAWVVGDIGGQSQSEEVGAGREKQWVACSFKGTSNTLMYLEAFFSIELFFFSFSFSFLTLGSQLFYFPVFLETSSRREV